MLNVFIDAINLLWLIFRFAIITIVIFSPFILYIIIADIPFKKDRKKFNKDCNNDVIYECNWTDWLGCKYKYKKSREIIFVEYLSIKGKNFKTWLKLCSWVLSSILIISIFSHIGLRNDNIKKYETVTKELYSISDNNGMYIKGSRYSFSGEDKIVYYYCVKTGSNSFEQKRLDSDICRIIETDSDKFYVEYICSYNDFFNKTWYEKIGRLLFPFEKPSEMNIDSATFYIPKGSVDNKFDIDNE